MSSLDTARVLRMPGVVVKDVYVDPAQLGVRMKNMVKVMLRQGYTSGSWGSQSRALATNIAQSHAVSLIIRNNDGFVAPLRGLYSSEVAEEVVKVLEADRAIYAAGLQGFEESYRQRCLERYSRCFDVIRKATTHRWVNVRRKELSAQACELFVAARPKDMLEKIEQLCDMLDKGEPISIKLPR